MELTPLASTGPSAAPEQPIRVLVVEAEAAQAALATAFLQQTLLLHGVQFILEWACTCSDASTRAAAAAYDALVLDYRFGDGDAVTLLEQVRAAGTSTPALVLTPSGAEDVAARVVRAGADDHLPKPEALIGDALGRAVLAMLERRRLAAALAEAQANAAQAQEVLLAARAMEQHLNTTLATAAGSSALLAASPRLPGHLRSLARAAADGATAAAETLSRFQRVARLKDDGGRAGRQAAAGKGPAEMAPALIGTARAGDAAAPRGGREGAARQGDRVNTMSTRGEHR
jgi:DNA-binding response OmpR family regulator